MTEGDSGMTPTRLATMLAMLAMPALFAPFLARVRGRISARAWSSCATLLCFEPLLAPWIVSGRASPLATWLVAIAGGIVMIRATDWLLNPRLEGDLIRVWLALTVWPALEIEDVGIRLPRLKERAQEAFQRCAAGLAGMAIGLALAAFGQMRMVPDRNILVDSIFKSLEIYLLAGGANNLLVGTFALAGFRVFDGFRYPILAHSVLDFWSRYNVWIHRWLKRHIFEPLAQRRRPALGILVVFASSGLMHEYLFLPAVPEVLGWQLAFFMLHGLGSIVGFQFGRTFQAVLRRRIPRPIAIAATMGFVLLTAPVFIHALDRVVDLHRDVGGWVIKRIIRGQVDVVLPVVHHRSVDIP
jgi:hypothetical protein